MTNGIGNERIGIVGLGRMGRAIAERLADTGFAVAGWNRTPRGDAGLPPDQLCAELEALAGRSDILVLSLFDDDALRDVLERLLAADLTGKLIADTSTVRPDTLAAYSARIGVAGAAAIDAPISGGPEMVTAGGAGMFLGGNERDVARFAPVAGALSRSARHIGPLGAGSAAKIVNNMLLMGCWEALREAVSVGRKAGLDPRVMIDFLCDGPAANGALKGRRAEVLGDSDRVGFPVSGVIKDAVMFRSVAESFGVETPAVDAALSGFRDAEAAGLGQDDLAALIRVALRGA